MERAKQLLAEKGVAGIVLPITYLTTGSIYTESRKQILKAFKVKGIVEFGGGTFMATSTNTIVLFLERRKDNEALTASELIKNVLSTKTDTEILDLENAVTLYAENIKGVAFEEYFNLLELPIGTPDLPEWLGEYHEAFVKSSFVTALQKQKTFKELTESKKTESLNNELKNYLLSKEAEKILFFLLTHIQKVVVVKAPSKKKDEKKFLGYEFSKRRGSEGIKFLKDKAGNIKSALYSDISLDDPEKVNFYIKKNFEDSLKEWDSVLQATAPKNINVFELTSLLDFSRPTFEADVNMSALAQKEHWDAVTKKVTGSDYGKQGTDWNPCKLIEIPNIEIDSGNGAPQGEDYFERGDKLFVRVSSLNKVDSSLVVNDDSDSLVNDLAISTYGLKPFKKGTIVFPKSGKAIDTNKIAILGKDCYVVNHLATIYIEDEVLRNYVFQYLKYFKTSNLAPRSGYPTISVSDLKRFKIPMPVASKMSKLPSWVTNII